MTLHWQHFDGPFWAATIDNHGNAVRINTETGRVTIGVPTLCKDLYTCMSDDEQDHGAGIFPYAETVVTEWLNGERE